MNIASEIATCTTVQGLNGFLFAHGMELRLSRHKLGNNWTCSASLTVVRDKGKIEANGTGPTLQDALAEAAKNLDAIMAGL